MYIYGENTTLKTTLFPFKTMHREFFDHSASAIAPICMRKPKCFKITAKLHCKSNYQSIFVALWLKHILVSVQYKATISPPKIEEEFCRVQRVQSSTMKITLFTFIYFDVNSSYPLKQLLAFTIVMYFLMCSDVWGVITITCITTQDGFFFQLCCFFQWSRRPQENFTGSLQTTDCALSVCNHMDITDKWGYINVEWIKGNAE